MSAAISFNEVSLPPFFEWLSFELEAGGTALIMTAREEESLVLLRLLTGLIHPAGGTVSVLGQGVGNLTADQCYALRRSLGIVLPNGGLVSNLKMWENITLPLLYLKGGITEQDSDEIVAHLRRLGYGGNLMVPPAHLSLYEKRVASFARAALLRPRLMVYCNCLEGIAPAARRSFLDGAASFHGADPARSSLYLASSAEYLAELTVDRVIYAHAPGRCEEQHDT